MPSRFQQGPEEAVSPVVGTIIMVAITVVIAAVLYLVVNSIKTSGSTSETLGFQIDETNDALYIVKVNDQPLWSTLEVRLSVAGDFDVGQPVQAGGDALAAEAFARMGGAANGPADAVITPGVSVYFCAEPGPASGVELSIRHVNSNTLVYRSKFVSMRDCPA